MAPIAVRWPKANSPQAMIELVGSELVKRAAERAKRKEERLKAQREGRDVEEEGDEKE